MVAFRAVNTFLIAASEIGKEPYNLLEWVYIVVLGLMTVAVGVFGLFVVARVVEPRGMKALLRRLAGKA